jgi:hypothetical protein
LDATVVGTSGPTGARYTTCTDMTPADAPSPGLDEAPAAAPAPHRPAWDREIAALRRDVEALHARLAATGERAGQAERARAGMRGRGG